MPSSAAERMRKYRKRLKDNPEKYNEYIRKEKARYQYRKDKGDIKSILEYKPREQRAIRKQWRLRKKIQRDKEKIGINDIRATPPQSPLEGTSDERRSAGRKKVRRDRSAAYRKIKHLEEQLIKEKRLKEKMKKRLYRLKKKCNTDSPRAKLKVLIKGQNINKETRRTLLFHNVLIDSIRKKYATAKSEREKHILTKAICSSLLKKYRLQSFARHQLKTTQRRITNKDQSFLSYNRQRRRDAIIFSMKESVKIFLSRDDNSRIKAGKKCTKTQNKVKQQVRLLNDTLKNLHLKYKAENVNSKMSYAMFCRLRPFYIRSKRASDRQTCLCKRHENVNFKSEKLKQLHILETDDLYSLAKQIVCDTNIKECMYGNCNICKEKKVSFLNECSNTGDMIEFFEWKTLRREVVTKESTKIVTITVKEREKCSLEVLMQEFDKELRKCLPHIFNISHQFMKIRELKEKLTDQDALLHVDFSENYICKYENEIQSMHFGASQKQLSLHTGIIYTSDVTLPFCSISDNLQHGPAGIWAHLKPPLELIKERFPSVTNLYFLSDGPTSQYKCKENFYMVTTVPFQMGFSRINWNFTEAGHGKGAPDGVGAVIKREADRLVLHSNDISGGDQLFKLLSEKNLKIQMFDAKEQDFTKFSQLLSSVCLSTVPGTMRIHQVINYIIN